MLPNVDYDSMTDEEFVAALKLDEEERALLESIESGEWVSVPNVEQEIQRLQAMAREQIARQKIEVNLSMQDTNKIYDLAEQFQKPVANLAQEIIHRYLGGELVEKV
ncbi:MAG: hypothetical protein DCF12_13685 [Snowella sp.]|jgi:hypothetical protein|nr:MAG: hypothetical protein DCF12_13685 [Snowella sp.]